MPFEIVAQSEYLLIKLKGECKGEFEANLKDSVSAMVLSSGIKLAIFQCSECGEITGAVLRQLAQIYKEFKTLNGQLRLVAANQQVLAIIKNNGLDRVLVNRLSLRGALLDFGLVKAKDFDVNFINPFLNSTQKVFKVQCLLDAQPQRPQLKKPTDPLLLGDVSGIISITSETFNGTLAISLPEAIFLKIITNMLGETPQGINEENIDLVGELANIILGQAKIELATLGYGIQMALPSCVWGKDHKIKHFGGGICVVVPFKTDAGIFYTEVMTNSNLLGQGKAETSSAA